MAKQQWDEAIAEFKKAIELDPKLAEPHYNLGLRCRQEPVGRSHCRIQKAIELDPKLAHGPLRPRLALQAKNQLDEAIAEYRKAIDLQPDYAEAHCNLAEYSSLTGPIIRLSRFL